MKQQSRWIFSLLGVGFIALVISAFADQGGPSGSSWPPDLTNYQRPAIPQDTGGGTASPLLGQVPAGPCLESS